MNERGEGGGEIEDYDDRWLLIPELCIYEEGAPPSAGEYHVCMRAGTVAITIRWTDAAGQKHLIEFGGPCDGKPRATDQPGVASVSFIQVDASTLDSTAFAADGSEVMYARRRKSEDGQLLCTLQRLRRADGSRYGIVQVYRRA